MGIETARDHIRELEALDWSIIFVDEAHRLKNRKSSTYKALNKFACKARFGLTVGPVRQWNYEGANEGSTRELLSRMTIRRCGLCSIGRIWAVLARPLNGRHTLSPL